MFIFFLIGISCSEPELELDNEFDPENPDYIAPETTILYTTPVLDGTLLNVNSVNVTWEGNDDDMEFQYSLDSAPWSEWSSIPTASFNYLDEGDHSLLVRGRYASGTEEEYPDTLEFEVDAIQGPSLRIYQLFTEVLETELFTIEIMAEQVNALSGAGITLRFPTSSLSLIGDTISLGSFFSDYQEKIIYFYSEEQSAGTTTFQLDIATIDDQEYVSGTGVIAVLEFEAQSAGTYSLEFDDNLTTLRNANNDVIPINELADGIIKIE